MGRVAAWVGTVVLLVGAVGYAAAQSAVGNAPETSVGVVLRNLAARAGVVFVGQVVRIEHKTGIVEIVFQVQQPVLGAVGATYTLREWSGLWAAGQQRYRLGQRAMIFLHTPGGSAGGGGLSWPVDGMEGVVPVVVQRADAAALLDVRWLAARVLRAKGAPIADAENGAIALADGAAVVAGWKQSAWHEPVRQPLPAGAEPAQQQPGVSAAGLVAGTTVEPARTIEPPRWTVMPPLGTTLELPTGTTELPPGTIDALQLRGAHGTVQAVWAGGPDGIR